MCKQSLCFSLFHTSDTEFNLRIISTAQIPNIAKNIYSKSPSGSVTHILLFSRRISFIIIAYQSPLMFTAHKNANNIRSRNATDYISLMTRFKKHIWAVLLFESCTSCHWQTYTFPAGRHCTNFRTSALHTLCDVLFPTWQTEYASICFSSSADIALPSDRLQSVFSNVCITDPHATEPSASAFPAN